MKGTEAPCRAHAAPSAPFWCDISRFSCNFFMMARFTEKFVTIVTLTILLINFTVAANSSFSDGENYSNLAINEDCPCIDRALCPRAYGEGELDRVELGEVVGCEADEGDESGVDLVRCCGVEVRFKRCGLIYLF